MLSLIHILCKAPAEKFKLQEGEKVWAAEHVVGVAKGVSEDIVSDLRANFEGECSEVGMYLSLIHISTELSTFFLIVCVLFVYCLTFYIHLSFHIFAIPAFSLSLIHI